jgi:protein-arginine kinase activator protein McsA
MDLKQFCLASKKWHSFMHLINMVPLEMTSWNQKDSVILAFVCPKCGLIAASQIAGSRQYYESCNDSAEEAVQSVLNKKKSHEKK